MHYLIEMLIAFLVLYGIVLFFQQTLKVNSGEGMLLSASVIALLFVVSSQDGDISILDLWDAVYCRCWNFAKRNPDCAQKAKGCAVFAGIGIPVRTVCVCAHYFLS